MQHDKTVKNNNHNENDNYNSNTTTNRNIKNRWKLIENSKSTNHNKTGQIITLFWLKTKTFKTLQKTKSKRNADEKQINAILNAEISTFISRHAYIHTYKPHILMYYQLSLVVAHIILYILIEEFKLR